MGARVWVTRAQPGAQATAERLAALGHDPVIAPLLRVRRLTAEIDLSGIEALAFTSANGVEAFAALTSERRLPAYAVGDASAQAARAAGFENVISADGDVAALAARIVADRPGQVLAPGAAERAGDLIGALEAAELAARAVVVYVTVAGEPGPDFDPEAVDVALVHSAKAGRALAAYLARRPAPDLEVCCLSLAAAGPLAATPLARLDAAESPSEAQLLALI